MIVLVIDRKKSPTSTDGEFPPGMPEGMLGRDVYGFESVDQASTWMLGRQFGTNTNVTFHEVGFPLLDPTLGVT